ncbi:MAG: ATP-binding protein [Vicinamibacterales bacterium]
MGRHEWRAGTNLLDIDFVAPAGADPNELYQIKLEGVDGDWSAPSSRRSVSVANLAPGNYRFVVRAVGTDRASGLSSDVELTVVAPMWRQGWFLGSAAAAGSALLLLAHRRRERRRHAIAAIRTRIAGDLHDDIGANLTRIAVLSEVAQRHGGVADRADASLASIGRIARESVTTMGDIIWAVNPPEDDLLELGRKLREHGGEVCTAAGIEFSMSVPGPGRNDRLPLDVRRDLFLIFKEAVTNAVRHASCTALQVCLRQDQGTIALEIVDNGRGLDQPVFRVGHGLDNMQRRATRLDARFHVGATAAGGTIVRVECQTRRRGHLFR